MLRIFGGDPDGKVARTLSYAGSERDISDPWYTGEFGTTYNDVHELYRIPSIFTTKWKNRHIS